MESTTHAHDQKTATPGELIAPVLSDLETVVGNVSPDQFGRPTPCPDFDVAALRRHILGWVDYFAIALNDPEGAEDRPDPGAFDAPDDPQRAAAIVAGSAQRITQAIEAGAADGPVKLVQASMPGGGVISMALWEYLMHGHDLAAATGQPWRPPEQAAQLALAFAKTMLTDEYRGPGKDFGPVVPVPDDAPALDRLLGFSGRDPRWTPPTA